MLSSGLPPEVYTDPPPPAHVKKGQPWQKVFNHMTKTGQEYLARGQTEPGRHKCAFHTAKKFAELGVDRKEARKALTRANKLQGKDEELPADQIEHALETAYGQEK